MIVFDTDILTIYSYGGEKASRLKQRLAQADDNTFYATVITRMEMLRGRFESIFKAADRNELSKAFQNLDKTEKLLDSIKILDINEKALDQFHEWDQSNRKAITVKLKRGDLLIACIALSHQATFITRNTKDFESVPNLRIENWLD